MRRLVTLAIMAALLVLIALPAMAQSEPTDPDAITLASLATVSGAVVASGLVVSFASVLVSMSARAKRIASAVVGFATVIVATIVAGDVSVVSLVLAAFTGMSAGLAASKLQEVSTEGLSHSVTRPTG